MTSRSNKQARDYDREYKKYHGTPKQRARRSQRTLTRYHLEKQGRVKKGDGKDVHHKDGNPGNRKASNLSVTSKSENRSFSRKTSDRKKYGRRK
jgi:hypothetical protein